MPKNTGAILVGMLGVLSILACTLGAATPTPTAAPPPTTASPPTDTVAPPTETVPAPTDTEAPPPTETAAPPTASGPCTVTISGEVTAYTRPSLEADVFGTVTIDIPIQAAAQTADGWIGFDPGVAQAANVGPFRLRWIQNGGPVSLTGDCSALPVIVGPPPGVCFEMFMETTDVKALPDPGAAVVITAQPQDYTEVDGRQGDWLRVNLSVGNLGITQEGWIPEAAANFNGPCDSLPVIAP